MPLAARQLIKVHLDSARFRMNKIKLAHAAEFHAFRTLAHPSFFSKIFCSYRRSVLHTLPNTVDNFTDLRSCIEKLARLIQTDASHQEKRHQYRYQCPFRRRSRHSVCPVFSRHITTNAQPKSEQRPPQGELQRPQPLSNQGSREFPLQYLS